MNLTKREKQPQQWHSIQFGFLVQLLGVGLVTIACSSGYQASFETAAPESGGAQTVALEPDVAGADTADAIATPQLIKTAELRLQVDNIEAQIKTATTLVKQAGGDILQLQDRTPIAESSPHTAYLQIRVPQARLDTTVEALAALGTVELQSLTAEDVSAQLVDFAARLRNLRKAEEMTLQIMERSGEIGDVLAVSQELSRIRESIEQISAQEQYLKTRVAFSTIELNMTESVTAPLPKGSWQRALQDAWQSSTRSLSQFTRGLLVLAIWLLVYSPYWLVLGIMLFFAYRLWRSLPRNRAEPRKQRRRIENRRPDEPPDTAESQIRD